jgi:hypothetical protein
MHIDFERMIVERRAGDILVDDPGWYKDSIVRARRAGPEA